MLLVDYVAAGFDPSGFWALTPRELGWHFEGAVERGVREHNGRAWQAYHTAVLPMMKRLPKLREIEARSPRRRARPQSREELVAVIKATFGALAARGERPKRRS